MGLLLLVLSVYSPNGTYAVQFLGNFATININDALLRVPGVGQVTNFGAADYAMRIWVKPDQLTKLGLTVSDLTNAVQQQSGRYNAKSAVIICVYQAPGSNALAVADQVKAQMVELKSRFPQDLEYKIAMDTTLPITEGMKEIVTTLFEAIVLVISVVFLFLQNWRATLIPLLAVPVSLIGTFAIFPILGFT